MGNQEKTDGFRSVPPGEGFFQGRKSAKKKKKVYLLEQWIEVRILEGKTVTTLYPSNRMLMERGHAMWPPPDLVYRRFNFPDGVPEEYRWVGMTADRATLGGSGLQRMTSATWLTLSTRDLTPGLSEFGRADAPGPDRRWESAPAGVAWRM